MLRQGSDIFNRVNGGGLPGRRPGLLDVLNAGGRIAGGIARGRAQGRVAEGNYNLESDAMRNRDALAFEQLRREDASRRGRQLMTADLMDAWKPSEDPRVQKLEFIDYSKVFNPETAARLRRQATAPDTVPRPHTPTRHRRTGLIPRSGFWMRWDWGRGCSMRFAIRDRP